MLLDNRKLVSNLGNYLKPLKKSITIHICSKCLLKKVITFCVHHPGNGHKWTSLRHRTGPG